MNRRRCNVAKYTIYAKKVYYYRKDIKNWKAEEKEWIEQDLSVADDSIELLCELKKNNLDVVLQKINEEIRNA